MKEDYQKLLATVIFTAGSDVEIKGFAIDIATDTCPRLKHPTASKRRLEEGKKIGSTMFNGRGLRRMKIVRESRKVAADLKVKVGALRSMDTFTAYCRSTSNWVGRLVS
jgi:hypothetical protein